MIRRFVYDAAQDRVIEVGTLRLGAPAPERAYSDTLGSYRELHTDEAGTALRNAALERADRRVFAHKRLGDERRWIET